MNKGRKREILKDCLKKHLGAIAVFFVMTCVNFAVFALYRIPLEPLVYAASVAAFIGILLFAVSYGREAQHAQKRARALYSIETEWANLPEARTLTERDYGEMVRKLGEEAEKLSASFADERKDTVDYYTTWAHQIKTPIAVMRLELASGDVPDAEALSSELFRIEQYVDMVLQYIRLGSESNDLVILEVDVDSVVRETIRKFASQFMYRKLHLEYEPCNLTIVTDRKWFGTILEQILSNALKYTPSGTIAIRMREGTKLAISDTGIGIAEEDLPRIFEKGYTGENGRIDQKSTGLGLYLTKRAADKLNIPIAVESEPGKGSTFLLNLEQQATLY